MNVDKTLTFVISVVIIVYIIISVFPTISESFSDTKKLIDETKNDLKYSSITNYIESKPNYYFNYEGATYCIPVNVLIEEKVVTESEEYKIDDILEATYSDNKYSFKVNNECIEK